MEKFKMQNFLFDFDGTIADSGDAATLATQVCFKDFGLEVPSAETVRYYIHTISDNAAYLSH